MILKRGLARNVAVIVVVLTVVFFAFLFFFVQLFGNMLSPIDGLRMGFEIESVDWDNITRQVKVCVRNVDTKDMTLSQIYVNGTLDNESVIVPKVLSPNQTAEITLSETYTIVPRQITIKIILEEDFSGTYKHVFIGFEMLRLDWDENTGKITVRVGNIGDYPEVNFGEIYVNGTLDDKAFVTEKNISASQGSPPCQKIYEISLSGTYVTKPKKMQLKIVTSDGLLFDLESPFNTRKMEIVPGYIGWFEDTGEIRFWVYAPYAGFLEEELPITFDEVYVNGKLDESAVITTVYSQGGAESYQVVLSKKYVTCPSQVTVKVITDFGEFCEGTGIDSTPSFRDIPHEEVEIINVQFSTDYITITAKNTGPEQVTFQKIFINNIEQTFEPFTVQASEQYSEKISFQWLSGTKYRITMYSTNSNVFHYAEVAP